MPTRKRTGTSKKTRGSSRAASSGRAKPGKRTAARASSTRKKTATKSTATRGGKAKTSKSTRSKTSRAPRSRTVATQPQTEAFEVVEIDVIALEPPVGAPGAMRIPEESFEEELLEALESETPQSAMGQAGVSGRAPWGGQANEEDEDSEAGIPE